MYNNPKKPKKKKKKRFKNKYFFYHSSWWIYDWATMFFSFYLSGTEKYGKDF